jgi:drug/metabolite transporter (DMT)-like permease
MASTARGVAAPDRERPSRSGVLVTDAMLLGMALIWGTNFSVVKYGTQWLAPLAYNSLRILLAAAAFAIIARLFSDQHVSARDRRALLALGVLGHGVYQVFFILGLARSRAGTVAIILAAGPAFSAIIGRLRGTEFVSRRGWIGIGMQLAGIAAVVLGTSAAAARGDTPLGMTLVLAGALAWALFSVLVKPFTARVSELQLGAITVFGGSMFVLVASIPALLGTDWGAVRPSAWGAVVYSGILALVVANLFWFRGVRVLGPTHTAMFSNLQPMIALGAAWVALGEVPTAWQVGGAVSIMSGLLISRT